jgi:DNA-binding transcriptional MerR regulator
MKEVESQWRIFFGNIDMGGGLLSMPQTGVWMSSKDAAVKLNVHVRTLRNWIDTFSPYMVLQKNSQGHYLLSDQAYQLLIEIKRIKDSGIQTLKEIEDVLLHEKILPERKTAVETESIKEATPEPHLAQEFMESINQRITQAFHEISAAVELQSSTTVRQEDETMQKEILKKMDEIEKKQETLKLEVRKNNFEMQLMNAMKNESRKNLLARFFRWLFMRKQQKVHLT